MVRTLAAQGFCNIICRNREELNLLDQAQVREFFLTTRPDFVFQAAAKVGGIGANSTQQADFLYENLVIACNVIGASAEAEVKK
ncbi:NAD-dependent epimerase/dehydratase family protein, partial [Acinetobacter baumannii]